MIKLDRSDARVFKWMWNFRSEDGISAVELNNKTVVEYHGSMCME